MPTVLLLVYYCNDPCILTPVNVHTGTCLGRLPVLGGPKSAILGQMSVSQPVFFNKFHVGCGTNRMATEKKHLCNFVSL